MKYFTLALKKYSDFTGKTSRKEFWMFLLFYILFSMGASIIDSVLNTTPFVSFILMVGLFIPNLAITFRRLRDAGKAGWWILVGWIPVIGVIWLLILLSQKSEVV